MVVTWLIWSGTQEYRTVRLSPIESEDHGMKDFALFDATASGTAALSRRSAMLRLGGGGLAVLLASRVISVAAQEAGTPEAGRAFLAIRQYELSPDHTMEELHAAVESGFMPIVKGVPGFLEYILVGTDDGAISISVFTDEAGAEESTARAADWVGESLAGFFTGPPTVTTGSVWLHEVGAEESGTPAP
jgi:hypothetical protein